MGTMLKILIVEDEVILAVELECVLEEMGHRVVGHAVGSRDAVELVARETPDLALIDLQLLDGPTGADTARIMARDFRSYSQSRPRILIGNLDHKRSLIIRCAAPNSLRYRSGLRLPLGRCQGQLVAFSI